MNHRPWIFYYYSNSLDQVQQLLDSPKVSNDNEIVFIYYDFSSIFYLK